MKIYKCGTEVELKASTLKGYISAISIRFDSIRYEIAYFWDGEIRREWLESGEFITDSKKQNIGFIK